jgi:PadR family transcriptional regulator
MAREPFSGHLDLLLLAALRDEPRHGYAVMDHVRKASGGRLDYPEGTVYPALHRLEADGLMKSGWREVDGRRRRVYSLTAKGVRALDSRRRDWERFAQSVAAVLESV